MGLAEPADDGTDEDRDAYAIQPMSIAAIVNMVHPAAEIARFRSTVSNAVGWPDGANGYTRPTTCMGVYCTDFIQSALDVSLTY
jgi:hypothetical protein